MIWSKIALLTVFSLAITGCGGDGERGDEAASTSSTTTTGAPVVLEAATDDPALDGVTVEGELGSEPTVTVDAPLSVDDTARRVLTEGDGPLAVEGASVSFHFVAFNATTGEPFDRSRPGDPPSVALDSTSLLPGLYRSMLDVPQGSRVVAAISPADGFGPQGGFPAQGIGPGDSLVFVIDLEKVAVPLERAEGTPVEPQPGLPTVTLAADGIPSIELPDADPPGELIGQVLIEGEGPVVETGQELTVHYVGVIWPGGEQFDSSWDRDPLTFTIGADPVIDGWTETLVGQTIGSQLVLVVPPEKGYGEAGQPEIGVESTDSLVFVVDLLAST